METYIYPGTSHQQKKSRNYIIQLFCLSLKYVVRMPVQNSGISDIANIMSSVLDIYKKNSFSDSVTRTCCCNYNHRFLH